jgi:hypothetical protein
MIYLASILVSIALFIGFLGLTIVEARKGTRVVLASSRTKLDHHVARASFVLKNVNWTSFFFQAFLSFAERIVHDVAQWSLVVVRFIERELTGVVRSLRYRRPNMLAPKPSRVPLRTQISKYLRSTFKGFVSSDKE